MSYIITVFEMTIINIRIRRIINNEPTRICFTLSYRDLSYSVWASFSGSGNLVVYRLTEPIYHWITPVVHHRFLFRGGFYTFITDPEFYDNTLLRKFIRCTTCRYITGPIMKGHRILIITNTVRWHRVETFNLLSL